MHEKKILWGGTHAGDGLVINIVTPLFQVKKMASLPLSPNEFGLVRSITKKTVLEPIVDTLTATRR